MSMESSEQRRIIEALVVASAEPISAARLAEIVPDCSPETAKELVGLLNTEYQESDRSFEIWEVAGGYQIRTRAEFSGYLQQLQKQRPLRLSRAAPDTLAIVAFKQPVTRGEVDGIRGVDSGAVLRSLLERRLLRIAGHRDVVGRPMLYGTTRRFLELFGLGSLKDLPSLRELEGLAGAREQGGQRVGDSAGGANSAAGDAAAPVDTSAAEAESIAEPVSEEEEVGVGDGSAAPADRSPEPEVSPADRDSG
jgi:segregation and condensation protein B